MTRWKICVKGYISAAAGLAFAALLLTACQRDTGYFGAAKAYIRHSRFPSPDFREVPLEEASRLLPSHRYRISHRHMSDAEKDRLASSVADRHCEFREALAGTRRKYPIDEFRLFAQATRLYVERTRKDRMIHREVAELINGLFDYLQVERKRVPGEVLAEAERLECLLFAGYDPHFDGDEPLGL